MFLKEIICIYFYFSAGTILYIVEKHPCLFFSKFGRNNLNTYNSKTHVIQTNFESPRGFGGREFNSISMILANVLPRKVRKLMN